jgi:hypothetical protein
MPASASASPKASDPGPVLRFPCGHVEREQAVERRARPRAGAIWVACERCNLIALIVGEAPEPRRLPA